MIKATLAEQAYHYIIEQIKYGNLKEGTKVDESEIVEELGISRTPVREALLQLASDDVIVNIAKRLFQNIRMFAFVRNKKRIEEYVRKLQKHSLCHLQAVEPDDILIMVIVSIEIYGFD